MREAIINVCKSLSKSKYIGIAPILKIDEITEGNVSFEIMILLFFFKPRAYSNDVHAVVPFEKVSAYFDPKYFPISDSKLNKYLGYLYKLCS